MDTNFKSMIANSPILVIGLLIVASLAITIGLYSGNAAAESQAQISSVTTANYAYHSDPWPGCDTIPSGGCMVGYRYFGIGDEVLLAVEYSAPVTVTGTPTITLLVGTVNRTATYKETQGSDLIFSYTVPEGDEDHDGLSIPSGSIDLNGGTINGAGDIAASLTHNGMGNQDWHRIDGVRPIFHGLSPLGGSDGADGVYSIGDSLAFSARFSESVYAKTGPADWSKSYLTASPTGPMAPTLRVRVGNKNRKAALSHEMGGLKFRYHIKKGDLAPNGPTVRANSIKLVDNLTFRDAAGNAVVSLNHGKVKTGSDFLIDAVRPKVSSIAITSTPANGKYYATGETISVTVTFDENMRALPTSGSDVNCGDFTDALPQLRIQVGNEARTGDLASISGPNVIFSYTVQENDRDSDGITIQKNSIVLPCGASLKDDVGLRWGANDAKRKHQAIRNASGHAVGESAD